MKYARTFAVVASVAFVASLSAGPLQAQKIHVVLGR